MWCHWLCVPGAINEIISHEQRVLVSIVGAVSRSGGTGGHCQSHRIRLYGGEKQTTCLGRLSCRHGHGNFPVAIGRAVSCARFFGKQ